MAVHDGLEGAYDGEAVGSLAARAMVPCLEVHAELTSALDRAHLLGASGTPAGTVVVADRQTAGRGRLGRVWHSEAGTGVWVALVERPSDTVALGVLSLRLGLAVAEALAPHSSSPIRLKWPNDLWTAAGKLAGVLVEARWRGSALEWVAIGVGVNVRPRGADPVVAGLDAGTRRPDVLSGCVARCARRPHGRAV